MSEALYTSEHSQPHPRGLSAACALGALSQRTCRMHAALAWSCGTIFLTDQG